MAGGYTFTFTWRVVFVLEVFVFLLLLCGKTSLKMKKRPVRLTGLALAVVLMVTYVTEIKTDWVTEAAGLDTILFTPNVLYRNNGIAGAFLSNLKYIDVEKPAGYSEKAAQAIADESLQKTECGDGGETATVTKATKESPNIIVIMNEAFSDLDIYGDFETSEDYMPFYPFSERIKGGGKKLYVSVKGGNTANTEFEFLTGNSMGFLPAGSVPYQQYIKAGPAFPGQPPRRSRIYHQRPSSLPCSGLVQRQGLSVAGF